MLIFIEFSDTPNTVQVYSLPRFIRLEILFAIISPATEPEVNPVSKTNKRPVFLNESVIVSQSMGLIDLKSIISQEIENFQQKISLRKETK